MPRRLLRFAAMTACAMLLVVAPAARAADVDRARPWSIAAAASLRPLLEAALDRYVEASGDSRPNVAYGSTGKHVAQIEHGAPFALFLAADMEGPQRLVERGLAIGPVLPFARGRLATWTLADSAPSIAQLAEPRWRRIAIANPLHAPYGAHALQALHAGGVHAAVATRLVHGENIGQAAQMVRSGAADVGIVAWALVVDGRVGGHHALVDARLHAPLLHGAVVTRHGRDEARARALLDYLRSDPMQVLLGEHGFAAP